MDTKIFIKSQYLAALKMLKDAIDKCPDDLWYDDEPLNKFWHISYHTLFYTHLYLANSENYFVTWDKHRDKYEKLGPLPAPASAKAKIDAAYGKGEVLEYLEICRKQVEEGVNSLNLDAASGFQWLPFNKMELQFHNIRHIQHHVGQLIDRLRIKENIKIKYQLGLQET